MKDGNGLKNQLKVIRTRLGLSQQELATAAGVARQTIGGIEAELYAPSAAVALRLSKALGCRIEDIFWLEEDEAKIEAVPATGMLQNETLRLTLAQVEGRWVAHSLQGKSAFREELIPADGIGTFAQEKSTLSVRLLDDPEVLSRTVILAGCTPALSLWARSAERWFPGLRVPWIHANSMAALSQLARGEIHAAGVHLYDAATGEYNAPFARQALPGRSVALVNLGIWEEGFLVSPGNPKQIRLAADLMRSDIRLINREGGAGARLLLDTQLKDEGISSDGISGYQCLAGSHQEVAEAIASGQADAGVSTASIAAIFGLGFVPLRQVRYDLVMLEEALQQEPVRQLLSTLQHRWVRSQLSVLGGYNTTLTGEVSVVVS